MPSREQNTRGAMGTGRRRKSPNVGVMAGADFDAAPSLSAAMGLLRCVHGETFPCVQCLANRRWNEAATGRNLTEAEFERQYTSEESRP